MAGAFTLGRKAQEPVTALDDRDPEVLLQLPDSARQGRLRHPAGLGRTSEVFLLRQGNRVLELPDIHEAQASTVRSFDSNRNRRWNHGCGQSTAGFRAPDRVSVHA